MGIDGADYQYTRYFENEVLRKRPYILPKWCIFIIENPIRIEEQPDGRVRFWGRIEEFDDRILRVVTLSDKVTIHNAFFDRNFRA